MINRWNMNSLATRNAIRRQNKIDKIEEIFDSLSKEECKDFYIEKEKIFKKLPFVHQEEKFDKLFEGKTLFTKCKICLDYINLEITTNNIMRVKQEPLWNNQTEYSNDDYEIFKTIIINGRI